MGIPALSLLSQYIVITYIVTYMSTYILTVLRNTIRIHVTEYIFRPKYIIPDPEYIQDTSGIHVGIHPRPPRNTCRPTIFSDGHACASPTAAQLTASLAAALGAGLPCHLCRLLGGLLRCWLRCWLRRGRHRWSRRSARAPTAPCCSRGRQSIGRVVMLVASHTYTTRPYRSVGW